VSYRDSLAEDHTPTPALFAGAANPPFAGFADTRATAKDLQRIVKTRKTELLFPPLFFRLLKTGGRGRSSCRTAFCRLQQGASGIAADAGGGAQARRRD